MSVAGDSPVRSVAGRSEKPPEGDTRRRPQRLFFALWPDTTLQERLHRLARERLGAAAAAGRGRLVPAANLHLTLAFLGAVDVAQRACLEAAADEIHIPPFTLLLDELDCPRRRGLYWASASHTPPALVALVQGLEEAQSRCGLGRATAEEKEEGRAFRPHVTLARRLVRSPRPEPISPPLAWTVARFCLVQSETRPDGARYTILRAWGLKQTGAR